MDNTKTRPTRTKSDAFGVELFQAVLDLCGIAYRRSYFDGGWTRLVSVDTPAGQVSASFDRWGVRFQGMMAPQVFTVVR